MDDARLLLEFLATGSNGAFAQIVRRHVDLVYACALRHVHDAQLAEDITQAAFLLLAKKASSLRQETVLAAWLLRATRYASLDAIKLRARRRKHELEAAQMIHSAQPMRSADSDAAQTELLDLLDEAMAHLSDSERRILVLRYYEKRSFPEIGEALGTTEESARKRVNRSIERLRAAFSRRGSVIASGCVVGIITAGLGDCAHAAPAGLAVRAGASSAFAGNIASTVARDVARNVARRMIFAQLRAVTACVCAGLGTCVLAGVLVHSLLVHHDRPPGPLPTVVEEHDHPG